MKYVEILWDADDGYQVDDPRHRWGATGCTEDRLEACLDDLSQGDVIISLFDSPMALKAHLDETGRTL